MVSEATPSLTPKIFLVTEFFPWNTLEKPSIQNISAWTRKNPSFILDLTKFPKSTTTSTMYKSHFYQIKEKFKNTNHCNIYTDGSKINGKVGAGLIFEEKACKYHLPETLSTYTAEEFCLMQATESINQNISIDNTFIIHTDSLSVIQNLKKMY